MTATQTPYIGQRVQRKEDPKLIRGEGTYTDDVTPAGTVYMALVRSPHAHARIRKIDTSRAKRAPGVVTVLTGADTAATGPLPCFITLPDLKTTKHFPLASDKARYAGDGVAVVVADSRRAARSAAALVDVEYEPLPVVTDARAATKPGAPILHDDIGTNVAYVYPVKGGDIDKAFREADVVVKHTVKNQRLIPNAIEPRSIVVRPDEGGALTIWTTTQIPHFVQLITSLNLGLSQNKVRVIAPEVGGGFGSKLNVYAEELLAAWLAKTLGKPVKWTEERREGYLATIHGRDIVEDVELAAKKDGTITGLRIRGTANLGAYLQAFTPVIETVLHIFIVPGAYRIPAFDCEIVGVHTNTTPTDAYRGAGRPEATYLIETSMNLLARELGMDQAEIRRKNFVPKDAFPYTTITTLAYDSGNYDGTLDRALAMADYAGFPKRRDEAKARGKLRGIGLSSYVEICGLAPSKANHALGVGWGGYESARIRVHPTGAVQVWTGTSPHGQGHETSWSQIVADAFGISPDDVEVRHGDTLEAPGMGVGTFGSRSLAVGGVAVHKAAEKLREKIRLIGAHMLEASPDDVVFEGGKVHVKGVPERAKAFGEIVFQSYLAFNIPDGMEPGMDSTVYYDPSNFTFPFGTHIAEVEIDPDTGTTQVVSYSACDDCGVQINPMIVEGQLHGGIVQGIGQALYEGAVYDENGQLVSGSMMEYDVPKAADLPIRIQLDHTTTPSPVNPLGVKGIGEAGTIASTPAVVNAALDALAAVGVTHIDMPLTPERVWAAIQGVKR
ncbi:MAG TPA: xanthine dehydrogenase family protein molybdopterin-binding subunit [Candidatus Limnocylindria bacterium]